MKIGILSDSHDNLVKLEKAVRFFNKNKVGFVLHAGDFIAPFALSKLENLKCNWRGVFGNNDGEKAGLLKRSAGKVAKGPLRITVYKRKISLAHDINTVNLAKEKADLAAFGHTHKAQISKQGNTLIVNPGECGGWLTGKSTVAIVNLATMSARIFKI
ncbi:MAG: metallophosphoesterase [Candidatus Omnitrophica bacterium]|nr:metallophosphoesterase [Candidatus Omnitrophota bacterium]